MHGFVQGSSKRNTNVITNFTMKPINYIMKKPFKHKPIYSNIHSPLCNSNLTIEEIVDYVHCPYSGDGYDDKPNSSL